MDQPALSGGGGFPCRHPGCRHAIRNIDGSSYASLQAASAARAIHELAEHGLEWRETPAPQAWRPVNFQRISENRKIIAERSRRGEH